MSVAFPVSDALLYWMLTFRSAFVSEIVITEFTTLSVPVPDIVNPPVPHIVNR